MSSFNIFRAGPARLVVTVIVLLLVSVLRAGSTLHYSTWSIDEHFFVPIAVGFLDFDLNPHWFLYHTLPMYIVACMYAVIYWFYELAGLVHSKVEFASLLFQNDALFYVSARLLVSFLHTLGVFVLALIVHRHYRSTLGAVLIFAAAILIPDSVLAANKVRVDSFVFLFLCLLILFSCYSEKNRRNFIFSVIACAAAIASKIPAVALFPVLLFALLVDIRHGRYPKSYLVYAIVGVPLLTLAFVPYAVLDFETYKHQVLQKIFNMASGGNRNKVAKTYNQGILLKLHYLFHRISEQVGVLSVAATTLAGLYALLRRDRRLGITVLYTLAYTLAFATSAYVDSYWLRPVYPLYIFLTVVITIEISRHSRWMALVQNLEQRVPLVRPAARLRGQALLLVLSVYFAIVAQPAAVAYYHGLTDTREDTRVLASRWISQHLPAGSIIILDTFLHHYVPRVFSPNPEITYKSFDYPYARINRLLVEGYRYYFKKNRGTTKHFRVAYLYSRALDFDPRKIVLPKNAYIVISTKTYDRYYTELALQNDPALTRRARRYYDAIQAMEPVETFTGRGPDITIYKVH